MSQISDAVACFYKFKTSVDVTIYEIRANNNEKVFQTFDDVKLSNLTEGVTVMTSDMIMLPANKKYRGKLAYTYAADSEQYEFSSETDVFGKP